MELTKRKRNQYYKKALKRLDVDDFICIALHNVSNIHYDFLEGTFPELEKRRPKDMDWGKPWWDFGKNYLRIRALEKCIKETSPKPKNNENSTVKPRRKTMVKRSSLHNGRKRSS